MQPCESSFLGLPSWFRGLAKPPECNVEISSAMDIWIIVVNIAQILLQLSIYFAIGFIIYGGVQFVLSQGSPDKIAAAKTTIANAAIGLVLAILSTAIVSYVAGLF